MNVDIELKIMECAKNSFMRLGFKETTLASVCQKAGVTTGAFYKRFSSKEKLLERIVLPEVQVFEEQLISTKKTSENTILPSWCLSYIYSHWEAFRLLVMCPDAALYKTCCSELTEAVIQSILMNRTISTENIPLVGLAAKSYLAGLFEVIRCNLNYEAAEGCIRSLDRLLVL